jgi:hypothetical protein
LNNSFFIAEKRQRYHLCRKGVANNKNMIKDRTTKKKKKKNTIASTILYIFYVFVVVQSQLLYECEAYSKVLNPAKAYKQELDSIANNSESNEEDDFMAPSVNPNDYKEFTKEYSKAAENTQFSEETGYHKENDVEGKLDLSMRATTHEILEALSDQAIAADAEEEIELVRDGVDVIDNDGFVVEHDHGDPKGHQCKPIVGLRGLETLRKNEKRLKEAHERGLSKQEAKKNPEGLLEREAAYVDAEETRIGYENCLTTVMPTLLKTTDFTATIRCETKVAHANFNKYRRDALKNKQWYDELPAKGRFAHQRGTISRKAGKVIALYNGYAVCVKETIPTLHLHLMDLHGVQKNKDDTHHLIERPKYDPRGIYKNNGKPAGGNSGLDKAVKDAFHLWSTKDANGIKIKPSKKGLRKLLSSSSSS